MNNKYHTSCIYKIYKDDWIYIGSSVNFKSRVSKHKSACNNTKSKKYNYKIYKLIRSNGGWEKFHKEKIIDVYCENSKELRKIEGTYIKMLRSEFKLNSNESGRSDKEYREDNKIKICEYGRQYRKINKEKLIKYRKDNKDKISIYNKRYREKIKQRKQS
tara:strand:+ start:331 stop:810 length:480 start_codon:yes stop_codon:yes gene_type:complete